MQTRQQTFGVWGWGITLRKFFGLEPPLQWLQLRRLFEAAYSECIKMFFDDDKYIMESHSCYQIWKSQWYQPFCTTSDCALAYALKVIKMIQLKFCMTSVKKIFWTV